jgi:pimeloyl-ACP methyl ester carboxylesterase
MRFVFLHGGPGFNSFAEQAILGPILDSAGHEVVFWNEPSQLRPDGEPFEATGAFDRWLASAERCVLSAAQSQPVHLITHSITVHPAVEIVRRHPGLVTTLVVVAPSADTFATFTNVLRLACEDLSNTVPEVAASLASCLERTRALLDEPLHEGLVHASNDDRLFTHYWADARQLEASLAARARPEAQFDPVSFFAVLTGFAQRGGSLLSTAAVNVPTLVLFGAQDRITAFDEQRGAIEAAIPSACIQVLDGCSHYLHLDRPLHFVDLIVDWATVHAESPADRSG